VLIAQEKYENLMPPASQQAWEIEKATVWPGEKIPPLRAAFTEEENLHIYLLIWEIECRIRTFHMVW
jgi:hypothetical protein